MYNKRNKKFQEDTMSKAFTDAMFFADLNQKYEGLADKAARFLENAQLLDSALWAKFVQQFRDQLDGTNEGWRGEFWGKMMRGACLVFEYTKNEDLYAVLTETVKDIITVAESDGRVSSFTRDTEFTAWDMWCRKYVILGMEYYLDICRDDTLRGEIIKFISRAANCILEKVGDGKDKIKITRTAKFWQGMNSCSILEPIVRLYGLTGEEKYLDFAAHIVACGGAECARIFDRAFENLVLPYQYGVAKAYEMMSCFEGLLELYRLTGNEQYKTAVINFAYAVIDSEISIIGSCGCTDELFDHTKNRQTQKTEDIMQETCVTVTWMKFCSQLLRLTGDSIFADQMELSFHNAYLGAINAEHNICKYINKKKKRVGIKTDAVYTYLPFDSYSPLIPGKRGQKVGGIQFFADNSYYGCCVCIGAAGVGVVLKHAILRDENGLVVNFYEKGEATVPMGAGNITIKTETEYPADGRIKITVTADTSASFELKLRIPAWSTDTKIDTDKVYTVQNGYAIISGEWKGESTIILDLDMSIRVTTPVVWDVDVLYTANRTRIRPPVIVKHCPEDDDYVSLSRGPITLCADSKMGKDANEEFTFETDGGNIICDKCPDRDIYDGRSCTVKCEFTDKNGQKFHLIDYASAGKDWDTDIAAWLPIPKK